ncbi:MAG: hypothetical protein IPK67_20305 [Planctomycetes bacterium]|nr:hypothetical protein [Planctomycetota bacterium]
MTSARQVRPYRPGDEAAILRAQSRVFSHVDPHWKGRTPESWRWRFLEVPAGSRIALEVLGDGEVRAQYAGLRQSMAGVAGPAHFTQSVDSFDTGRVDGGLSRKSGFVRAGEWFAREYGGSGESRDQVVFGLAIPAAWRIGSACLGYEHVRSVCSLAARLGELDARRPSGLTLEETPRAPADSAELFQRVAAERGILAVRDARILDWRFARHPEQRYVFGALREGSLLRGLGVFRRGSFAGEEGGLLCDWLAPGEDRDAQAGLLAWFAERTRAAGASQLVALFPDTSPEWLELQGRGFRVLPTPYVLAARSFSAPFDRDFLFWRWYYTLGDTDLV